MVLPDALAHRWPGEAGTTEADLRAAVELHMRFNVLDGVQDYQRPVAPARLWV